jgi:hypothetical protein
MPKEGRDRPKPRGSTGHKSGRPDWAEHRESGMIRVAMTYRLCSPPTFWTVSHENGYDTSAIDD